MIQTKIKLNFTDNPDVGSGISYGIYILGISNLVYNNGLDYVNLEYVSNSTPIEIPNKISLGLSKDETIDNTLSFLYNFWTHPNIIYSRDVDSIYVTLTLDDISSVSYSNSPDITITVTATSVGEGFTPVYLKYFFKYKNIAGDFYKCEVYTKRIVEIPAIEIHGKIIIDKSSIKDHLDAIRGGGISLQIEANTGETFDDLYNENEQDLPVRLYRNNVMFFSGFINPEGLFQSFVNDIWIITLDCVDGLGSLSNLSFVRDNGFPFVGKIKAIDIIYYCLKRTGILLPINTSVNIFYDGLSIDETTDILNKIHLNADRYQRIDNDTIMSCEEVLRSILDLFSACITQQNGEWYIYKTNELFSNAVVKFKKYSIDNVYIGIKEINLSKQLGSNIDNFYPHHSGGNQNIQIKGSISKYRVNYKYGFESELTLNSNLSHDINLVYPNWTINTDNFSSLVLNPIDFYGLKMIPTDVTTKIIATSQPVFLRQDYTFDFKVSVRSNGNTNFYFQIRVGTYYMDNGGRWSTSPKKIVLTARPSSNVPVDYTYTYKSLPLPIDGDVSIDIFVPFKGLDFPSTFTEVKNVDIINSFSGDNILGEFHTVERSIRVSSNVKDVKLIYNGDSPTTVYLGAVFKEDQVTPTETWSRKGRLESFPLLRIASEEELRISQKPLKIFTGSIYGYIPYLSVININNVGSKFMFIEYSYDTMTNIGNYKLLELFASEIQDIIYKFTFDYGNTVKPTIVS